jgi:hypothetical protein
LVNNLNLDLNYGFKLRDLTSSFALGLNCGPMKVFGVFVTWDVTILGKKLSISCGKTVTTIMATICDGYISYLLYGLPYLLFVWTLVWIYVSLFCVE